MSGVRFQGHLLRTPRELRGCSFHPQVKGESEAKQRLALLTLGGIGRCTDLSGSADVQSSITGAISSHREVSSLQTNLQIGS